jgi:hypothetical protein
MDSFEHYLKENRLRLDTDDLDPQCWKEVESLFRQQRRKRTLRRVTMAASIAVVLGIGSLFFIYHADRNKPAPQSTIFPPAFTELSKQETSYLQLIGLTEDEIRKQRIPEEYKSLFNDFIDQLHIIDQQYELYKAEIEKHGYTDELIQQVIYNYQLKLSVLQMLRSEMNKINNLSKQNKNENKNIQLNI